MKAKKNPKSKLENYCRLFLLLGLASTLLGVYIFLEMETDTKDSMAKFVVEKTYINTDDLDIPEVKIEPALPEKPQEVVQHIPILADIKIIEDDDESIEETIIASTEVSESDAVEIVKITIEDIEEEEIVEVVQEDVPFMVIEKVPIYPGCTGNREALSTCMHQKIRTHVAENFNIDLAQELGLSAGKKRIFVQFVIDENGRIVSIKSRAPHKRLQAEAKRIIQSLPQMTPGRQRGKPVRVRYNLPIVFEVL